MKKFLMFFMILISIFLFSCGDHKYKEFYISKIEISSDKIAYYKVSSKEFINLENMIEDFWIQDTIGRYKVGDIFYKSSIPSGN